MTLHQKTLKMFLIMEYPLSGLQVQVMALNAEQVETMIALHQWGMNLWAMLQPDPQFLNPMDKELFNAHRHDINEIRHALGMACWTQDLIESF